MTKIINLHPITKYETELYGFSLSVDGFLVNGFTYNPVSRSMKMPSCTFKGKRVPLVKTYGAQINRLRKQIDAAIELAKGDQSGIDNEGSGNTRSE